MKERPDEGAWIAKQLRFRVFTLPAKVIAHARGLIARIANRLLTLADALAVRTRILSLAG